MTSTTTTTSTKEKIVLIGSGNWGSVIAKIIGENVLTQERSKLFERTINMWVYEEQVEGRNLTDIINERHENVKYLPGVRLPENIVAEPDLLKAAKDATILIFVVPHQFITRICGQLAAAGLNPRAKAISLIKGVDFSNNKLQLVSELISECLKIDVSVLMGANVAAEVATGAFCETTIGARSKENGEIFKLLFQTPTFLVNVVNDVAGVELCGALKNVIALGAGFVDGMGLGSNTKAAVIRIGVAEMKKFAETFYQGILVDTFFESCGIADVITTCYSGRNRKVAEAMIKTGRSCEDLEKEMLNGQKLQGPITAKEIYDILASRNLLKEFPMFVRIYRICFEGKPASSLLEGW